MDPSTSIKPSELPTLQPNESPSHNPSLTPTFITNHPSAGILKVVQLFLLIKKK